MKGFLITLRSSLVLLLVFTVLLGGIYPLVVTVTAQAVFHDKANGSLMRRGDAVIGSRLIGQQFESPQYFWGRLSATTPAYNASASGGSNMSPANLKLVEAANKRIAALRKADPANKEPVPVELVTASASGLDPHITRAAVEYQLPRVAHERNMRPELVQELVNKHTESAGFGLFGIDYVNVLALNLALDEAAKPAAKEKR